MAHFTLHARTRCGVYHRLSASMHDTRIRKDMAFFMHRSPDWTLWVSKEGSPDAHPRFYQFDPDHDDWETYARRTFGDL